MRRCEHCGSDIDHLRRQARFCDRTCKMASWHARNRATAEGKAREKVRNKARYGAEAEGRRAQARDHYHRNQELRIGYAREWRAENPHRRRVQGERRAERMVSNPGFRPFGLAEWQALCNRFNNCCAYCGERPFGSLQKDHVVPLSRGGRHAIANILPACAKCNAAKSDLFLATWKVRSTYPGR